MRTRPALDLRPGRYPAAATDTAGPGAARRAARALRLPASITAAGLIIALAALPAPGGVRLAAEVIAGLLVPGAVFHLSFARIPEPPIRLGATLIAVIAAWTGAGTAGYAVHHALYGGAAPSDGLAIVMLVVVYALGLATVMLTRPSRLWSRSDPPPDLEPEPDVPVPSQDHLEHPSSH
jgi:hypothetical protein